MVHAKRVKRTAKIDKLTTILQNAVEIFGKKGYVKTGISEVAQMSGVASGTIYLYYKNKDDLLIHAMQHMMESTLKEIKEKIACEKLSIDKLYMFFYHHIEVFTHQPNMARFLVVELRQCEEFYKRYPSYNPYHAYLDYVQELIKQAILEGTTKPYNPVTVSYLILGAMDTVVTQWVINPDSVNLQAVTAEMREILHNGMKTD